MDLINAAVEERGFPDVTTCRAGNERLDTVRYDLWVSPDRPVFAVVGAGTIIGLPQQSTGLTIKPVDGRVLITLDKPAGMSTGRSGMAAGKVVTNADFHELRARHRAGIEAEVTPDEPYAADDSRGDHRPLIGPRTERRARAGYVESLDGRRDTGRFHTRGAFACVSQQCRDTDREFSADFDRQAGAADRVSFLGLFPPKACRTDSILVSLHRGAAQPGIVFLVSIDRGT